MVKQTKHKIGIAIPCFNNLDVLKYSIPAINNDNFLITLFDDGSSDGTESWVKENYPNIRYLKGDSFNWWTGSLSKLIDYCLKQDCDYIVSLNADVVISPKNVELLVERSSKENNAIVASLVVDFKNTTQILWAGSNFKKIHKFIPIYASRYITKAGSEINDAKENAYRVDEVHGRGVLFPKEVFKQIGNYDYITFPHYGGDTDFSFRAKKNNISMIVEPKSIAKVFSENTSLNKKEKKTFFKKLFSVKDYLFDRKSGEALRLWWNLYKKHLPRRYFLQSYLFVILLNIYRRLWN